MMKLNASKKKKSTKTALIHSKYRSNIAKELRQAVLLDPCNRIEEAKSA